MHYYPLMLQTTGRSAVLVGAGEVGCRKLRDLLATSIASVLVLEPNPTAEAQTLCADPRIRLEKRGFEPLDVRNATLVFAATGSSAVNAAVVAACDEHRILCNSVDNPESGGFIVPARVVAGRVLITVSTQGASPALSRRLRSDLENFAEPYAALGELLARLRPFVLALNEPCGQNATLFRSIAGSALCAALAEHNAPHCEALLRELLPASLHHVIAELLHELV